MFITSRDIYDARFSNDAKVADMIVNDKWIWPEDWWIKFPILNFLSSLRIMIKWYGWIVIIRNPNFLLGVFGRA